MPQPCSLLFQGKFGYGNCRCSNWAVMYCRSKDEALALWDAHANPLPPAHDEVVTHG